MLTTHDLHDLVQALGDRPVLSVYLDAQPGHPRTTRSVRARLTAACDTATEASVTGRTSHDPDLRAALDRAVACLDDARTSSPAGAASSWVAFVTPDQVHYVGSIPVNVPTRVLWHRGPVLAPYYRALKLQQPVLVAIVHARSGRVYRHAWNALGVVADISLAEYERQHEQRGALSPRGRARPGVRSAVSTETAERKRTAAVRRMASAVADRLVALAGDTAWIVIGGAAEHARSVAAALPAALADRVRVTTALDHASKPADIARAAREAASALRAARQRRLVDAALGVTTSLHNGARGLGATRRALELRAVDTLLLTPKLLEAAPLLAEHLTREAHEQGATVEVLSGSAARRLDVHVGGIAARLRFALPWAVRGPEPHVGIPTVRGHRQRTSRLARQRRQRAIRRVRRRA